VRSLADKVYTYIILPMGLTKSFFDKFPLCDLKGESHIFVYMDKIFSQHYFSNSLCNSLAELEAIIILVIYCMSSFLAVLQTSFCMPDICIIQQALLHTYLNV